MHYRSSAIPESDIPQAADPRWQHVLETYASEINKVYSTWSEFADGDLDFRPHPKSMTVRDVMKHQLLSERRFFGEFLQTAEPAAAEVLPPDASVQAYCSRLVELARRRLAFLARQDETWWLTVAAFFDVTRQRIWIFWRRILHTAHHRTQLTVYLRLLDKPVPAIYGPTADVVWEGADPTQSVAAAGRRSTSPPSPAAADTSPERPETQSPDGSSH
ncbi:MAG TPA: DinB family protein [Bryobacteraceae bacterium]|nr:DinB family protein [Bryobacteraceae bacterium]